MRALPSLVWVVVVLMAGLATAEVNQDWLLRVPTAERARTNPYYGQQDAVAAGARLYANHCSRCHGADLQGANGKPSLRTETVRDASDGELFWLLRNGDLRHGMPSWSSLPEPERWQILAYIRGSVETHTPGR